LVKYGCNFWRLENLRFTWLSMVVTFGG